MDTGTGRQKPETRCPKDNQPSKAIQIKRVQYKDEYSWIESLWGCVGAGEFDNPNKSSCVISFPQYLFHLSLIPQNVLVYWFSDSNADSTSGSVKDRRRGLLQVYFGKKSYWNRKKLFYRFRVQIDVDGGSAKINKVAQVIQQHQSILGKAVIFSSYTQFLHILKNKLQNVLGSDGAIQIAAPLRSQLPRNLESQ